MIDEFEKAKSNQSKCSRCSKPIKKGEYRGIENYTTAFSYASKRFYCIKCSEEIIKEAREELAELTTKLTANLKKVGIKVI